MPQVQRGAEAAAANVDWDDADDNVVDDSEAELL